MGNCSCPQYQDCEDLAVEARRATDTIPAAEETGAVKLVDLDDLLRQLRLVEGDQKSQDALFRDLQSQGTAMILTVGIDEQNHLRMLRILHYLRALLAMKIWSSDVRLVKSDGNRFFIFASSTAAALKAAFSVKDLLKDFHTWLGDVCEEIGPLPRPVTVKAGMSDGGILLIPSDCFGDPVNVASKLGEDIAKADEIILCARSVAENTRDSELNTIVAQCTLTPKTSQISGLSLDHLVVEDAKLHAVVSPVALPTKQDLATCLRRDGACGATSEELVIMTSDMSGFTRLTKAYGILHFLRLVLESRAIMLPAADSVGGRAVKFEGDNVIMAFPSIAAAAICVESCLRQISEFNSAREKDFQIRIGFGLDVGEVHILGHDIVGAAFDCSFELAEDIAEVGEVLVGHSIKAAGWPSAQAAKFSEEKQVEGSGHRYHALTL